MGADAEVVGVVRRERSRAAAVSRWYSGPGRSVPPAGVVVRGPADVVEVVRGHLRWDRETFFRIDFDTRHRVLGVEVVSVGSLGASLVHPREVFRSVLMSPVPIAWVLFAHNHPSGDVAPSEDDIEITVRLRDVGELVGVPVVDHVIVGTDAAQVGDGVSPGGDLPFFSMREQRLL